MALKIHHLNCGTLCPKGARLFGDKGGLLGKTVLACHCLLIETHQGLVLVDTGFGFKDMLNPSWTGLKATQLMMSAQLRPEQSAIEQIRQLGFKPEDVRHIIITHLHPDHAGGLMDFPHAEIHILDKEYTAATSPITLVEKASYRPYLWAHEPNWHIHRFEGERWHDFESVQVLSDALYDILLIPLQGHTRGHCGVAVSTTEGWLLHCGDAYMHRNEIAADNPRSSIGHKLLQLLDDANTAERIHNQRRLQQLNREHGNIKLICSHDHSEFESCAGCHPQLGRAA